MNRECWPWKPQNFVFGDFERSYFQVLNQDRRILERSHKRKISFGPHFLYPEIQSVGMYQVMLTEFHMQFHNIIHSLESLNLKQKMIDKFKQGNDKNKHYILAFMMGITSHWVSLVAHKLNDKVEFLFYDSRNINYLNWND